MWQVAADSMATQTEQTHAQGRASDLATGGLVGGRRAARRLESEERRKQWRLRWLDIMQTAVKNGKSGRDAIALTADDAAKLATENPQMKTEITRAFDELHTALSSALRRFVATTPNIAHQPTPPSGH